MTLNRSFQLLIVIASSILSLVSTDILLPSLPQMAEHFSTSPETIKMVISVFMFGQFTTALFWGMIADRFGRRKALFWGMSIFLLGALLSLNTASIFLFLAARFIQGAGSITIPIAGWALIQDLYPKDEGARILNWVGSFVAIIPLFAPALGGMIDVAYGWKTSLYGIAAYSLVLSTIMLFFPKHDELIKSSASPSLKNRVMIYTEIIKNRTFVSYIALFGLFQSGEWCFLTMAPFYFAGRQLAPNQIGVLLMISSTGFALGAFLASRWMGRLGIDKTLSIGVQIGIASSFLLFLGDVLHWSDAPLFTATDIGLYVLSSALLWGGTTSRALQCFDDCRGSASAVRSLILLCFSSFGSYSGQFIQHDNLLPMSLFLMGTALCAVVLFNNKELKSERMETHPTA